MCLIVLIFRFQVVFYFQNSLTRYLHVRTTANALYFIGIGNIIPVNEIVIIKTIFYDHNISISLTRRVCTVVNRVNRVECSRRSADVYRVMHFYCVLPNEHKTFNRRCCTFTVYTSRDEADDYANAATSIVSAQATIIRYRRLTHVLAACVYSAVLYS